MRTRAGAILIQNNWVKQTDYAKLPFGESLQAFARQRKMLFQTLTVLRFEDWSRGALIGERRHTVVTQARWVAKHEAEHCLQVDELLNP
jgi:hypothetical protein